jgi:hypothetical protein
MFIALNKSDLMSKSELDKAEEDAREKISFAPFAPIVHISAKTGRGLGELFDTIDQVSESFHRRVGTGELNRFFEAVLATRPPPTMGGRAPRLYYITQAETAPPVFVVLASSPDSVHFSYQRFVANQLREHFTFDGVPLRIVYRERRRGGRGRTETELIEAMPAPAPKTGRRPAPGDTIVPRKPKRVPAPAPVEDDSPRPTVAAKSAAKTAAKQAAKAAPKKRARGKAAPIVLAFDHAKIITRAYRRLCRHLDDPTVDLAFDVLPPRFTLEELRRTYEVIIGKALTARTIRGHMLDRALIVPATTKPTAKPAAQLYRWNRP